MKPPSQHGLKRVLRATGFSIQGLKSAWHHEAAFREEVILSLILIPIALLLDVSLVEKLVLIGTVFLVLITELINSAIEAVVDRFGGEIHELSGRAKDIGSAAVLLSLLFAGGCWLAIIVNHFVL